MASAAQRKVGNVSEYRVDQKTCLAGQPVQFVIDVPREQYWRIEGIYIRAAPMMNVDISYQEEMQANDIQIGQLKAWEVPLRFKKTATDNHLTLAPERKLTIKVTDTYSQGSKQVRLKVKFIRVLPDVAAIAR